MKSSLEQLIQVYSNHLIHGEANLKKITISGNKDSCDYLKQKDINNLWRLFIKDLMALADKESNDHKKRHKPSIPGPTSRKNMP